MQRTAVFPGSFDPVTRGHESVVRRALPLFDRIIIAIGVNSSKTPFFPPEQRIEWLEQLFAGEPKVEVATYEGLTVDFCRIVNAGYILRGLRSAADLEFESSIAQMNRMMQPEVETVFLLCDPEFAPVSSTIVREIIRNGGDAGRFLPEGIQVAK